MTSPARPIRVIHIPASVGGNPQGISHHLKCLGYASETWTLLDSPFGYPADRNIYAPSERFLVRQLKRIGALRYAFLADVAFLNSGTSLFAPIAVASASPRGLLGAFSLLFSFYLRAMRRLEFAILKARNVVVLLQYQGDDARQGDVCRREYAISIAAAMQGTDYYTPTTDAVKRANIAWYAARCHQVYALNPDLLRVLPVSAQFLPYANVPVREMSPAYPGDTGLPLRIGHAPSHRGVKGTELILSAFERLRAKGHVFDLELIEGVSHAEAMRRYREVDVVVDQLFAGWYGGLAVECMAMGKPVVCYLRDDDLGYLPAEMREELPMIRAEPDTIETALERVLTMPRPALAEIAVRSRSYVERWHDPDAIARRVDADIRRHRAGLPFPLAANS